MLSGDASPLRRRNERLLFCENEIVGEYKYINHGLDITAEVKQSSFDSVKSGLYHFGNVSGTWESDGSNLTLMIDGERYSGVLVRQWDDDNAAWLMAFTALSAKGVTVWCQQIGKIVLGVRNSF